MPKHARHAAPAVIAKNLRLDNAERNRLLDQYAREKMKNDQVREGINTHLDYYTQKKKKKKRHDTSSEDSSSEEVVRKKVKAKGKGCACSDYFCCFIIPRASCVTGACKCSTRLVLLGWFYLFFFGILLATLFGGFNLVSYSYAAIKMLMNAAFGKLLSHSPIPVFPQ